MSYGDHVNYNTGESCMCSSLGDHGDSHRAVKPRMGWVCPKCGVVYAPWVIKCDYHKPNEGGE